MMLQYHPHYRPSLVDIIGHAWVRGPTASSEQVRAEFAARHEVNRKKALADYEAKQAERQKIIREKQRREFLSNGVTYRDLKFLTEDEENKSFDAAK